ncbi:hypothetical protein BVY04_03400 [bacterium M21]|nr:hypothetical protein BVY04_03400 [bacterium M21]
MVVNAKGGSEIQPWEPTGKFFKDAVRWAQAASQTGQLKGILWHQGEANVEDPEYVVKLVKLIQALRNAFGNEQLPFVAGQITPERERHSTSTY